jgi:hypothetical protein
MESNNIMGLVAAFIGVAIIIGIGAQILGNAVSDCTTFPDFVDITLNSTGGTDPPLQTQGGWAGECESINTQTQTAFALLVIVLIVIAAVIILSVVKML